MESLGERLPWIAAQGITTHWLRHTTFTWIERHFGYGIARAQEGIWGLFQDRLWRTSGGGVGVPGGAGVWGLS